MSDDTKIKVRKENDGALVLTLVKHPMETGQRVDSKTKQKIPAHFIQKMNFYLAGKKVAEANLGPAVSKNPLIGVKIPNAKSGAKVKIEWSDNMGKSGGAEAIVP